MDRRAAGGWERWRQTHRWLPRDMAVRETIDDMRIYVGYLDDPDFFGWAGAFWVRLINSRPLLGAASIHPEAFDGGHGYLTALHEIGHVLAISERLGDAGLVEGTGDNRRFTGVWARDAFSRAGGWRYRGPKVPLDGTTWHWKESAFGDELMTATWRTGDEEPISRVTVAALQDLGYEVDLGQADSYSVPRTSSKPVGGDVRGRCGFQPLPAMVAP